MFCFRLLLRPYFRFAWSGFATPTVLVWISDASLCRPRPLLDCVAPLVRPPPLPSLSRLLHLPVFARSPASPAPALVVLCCPAPLPLPCLSQLPRFPLTLALRRILPPSAFSAFTRAKCAPDSFFSLFSLPCSAPLSRTYRLSPRSTFLLAAPV